MPFVEFKNVYKRYKMGEVTISASDGVSFEIEKGEFVVIVGASGAGKTTILNMLGGMDTCDEGEIIVDGQNIAAYNRRQLTAYRRYDIGFVFQFYNLVNNLTAKENVELAAQITKDAADPLKVLSEVGLADHMKKFPVELSGGEQQRVSIARALAKDSRLLLCDEPTGALDYETGKQILVELDRLVRDYGKTIVVVTHTQEIGKMAHRVIRMRSGAVTGVTVNPQRVAAADIEW